MGWLRRRARSSSQPRRKARCHPLQTQASRPFVFRRPVPEAWAQLGHPAAQIGTTGGWAGPCHPRLEGRGSAGFGRHHPRSRWSEVLRKATPGMRDQSAPRVFADHEWVQSSASPASARAAGSGWSSRVLSPSATGLRTALGTDTGRPPGQPSFFHSKDSGWGRYPAKLFSVPISKPGRQRRRLSSDKKGSRHPFQRS